MMEVWLLLHWMWLLLATLGCHPSWATSMQALLFHQVWLLLEMRLLHVPTRQMWGHLVGRRPDRGLEPLLHWPIHGVFHQGRGGLSPGGQPQRLQVLGRKIRTHVTREEGGGSVPRGHGKVQGVGGPSQAAQPLH